jgi:RNA polymerase sigma factor (sigma-70 family)
LLDISQSRSKKGPVSLTEERELISSWLTDRDQDALHALIVAYYPFILKVVRDHNSKRERQADLVSDAIIALIEAMETFEPRAEIRFLSYARSFIKSAVVESRRFMEAQIDIPRHAFRTGEAPTNMTAAEVKTALSNAVNFSDVADELPAGEETCPQHSVSQKDTISFWRDSLEEAISDLPEDERRVMAYRLDESDERIKDIASRIGISTARARALEARAMMRLRLSLSNQGLNFSQIVGA